MIYSILDGGPMPEVSWAAMPTYRLSPRSLNPERIVLRMAYQGGVVSSALLADRHPDRSADLIFLAEPGKEAEHVANVEHHHVSALARDAAAYAAAIDVGLFYLFADRPRAFMEARFPEFVVNEATSDEKWTRMEWRA